MKQGRNISFYIEIVLMLIISVLAISILANAFSKSDLNSRKAKQLSDAVTLAASGAEVFLASESEEDVLKTLNEADNAFFGTSNKTAANPASGAANNGSAATSSAAANGDITATYNDDLQPDANGKMKMTIHWDEAGDFVNGTVTVFYGEEKIYDLETGFSKEGGR